MSSQLLVVAPSPERLNADVIERLTNMLEAAKAGEISDFVAVFIKNGEPQFSHAYCVQRRLQIIGALDVLQHDLVVLMMTEEIK
jgi:hypothetical protein